MKKQTGRDRAIEKLTADLEGLTREALAIRATCRPQTLRSGRHFLLQRVGF